MNVSKLVTTALEKAGISVSSIKLALSNIKLEEAQAPATPPSQLASQTTEPAKTEVKLNDGTSILVEGEVKEGAKVSIITPEGSVEVMDGDYTAEDGTVYSVSGGMITAVTPVAQAAAPAAPDMSALMNTLMDRVSKLETANTEIQAHSATLKAELDAVKGATTTALSAVEAIASMDAGEPVLNAKKWEEMTSLERRNYNRKK